MTGIERVSFSGRSASRHVVMVHVEFTPFCHSCNRKHEQPYMVMLVVESSRQKEKAVGDFESALALAREWFTGALK